MFDRIVLPILCEIWAPVISDICGKLLLRLCKRILKVRKSTPSCVELGEWGHFPVSLIKSRISVFGLN